MQMLDRFPDLQRRVLRLRIRDGLEWEEVGRRIGKSAEAARKLYRRAFDKLIDGHESPAHSVGDSLDFAVGSSVTPIEGVRNLYALELAAEEEAERFREQYDIVLKKITEKGTWFDKHDINGFFSLTLPGLNEVMAIIKIANLLRDDRFDVIIVDTAPTGHTIKLLAMPAEMEKWISVLELMQLSTLLS